MTTLNLRTPNFMAKFETFYLDVVLFAQVGTHTRNFLAMIIFLYHRTDCKQCKYVTDLKPHADF
jgi:hypothetical protein